MIKITMRTSVFLFNIYTFNIYTNKGSANDAVGLFNKILDCMPKPTMSPHVVLDVYSEDLFGYMYLYCVSAVTMVIVLRAIEVFIFLDTLFKFEQILQPL